MSDHNVYNTEKWLYKQVECIEIDYIYIELYVRNREEG